LANPSFRGEDSDVGVGDGAFVNVVG
jgi:hypothetical protein